MEDIRLEEPAEQITRVNEIPELRDENRKVFRLSNGDEQAVFCEPMMCLMNPPLRLPRLTTRLQRKRTNGITAAAEIAFARFSREEENDELFSVEKGMCRVSVSAKRRQPARA
ncbi:MAG: hypothetical protein ACLUFV_11500 [Acutalibacteraceae bacterium]